MVKYPDRPIFQILLTRISHCLNKYRRNKNIEQVLRRSKYLPKMLTCSSPTYTYTERNDNLKLCIIQNTLIYTFLDDTFDSPYIRCPHKIWCLTRVPDHRPSTPIKFKNSIRKLPILRSSYQNQKGLLVTDFRHTLQYHQVHTWEATGSEHTGFKDRKNSL